MKEYARRCLDSDEEKFRILAWRFVRQTKDEGVKDRYFTLLESGKWDGREETTRVRASLRPGAAVAFDEERENKFLLGQLAPDSFAAKVEGTIRPFGPGVPWRSDGRPGVVSVIGKRKVTDRKQWSEDAGPLLLKVLQEKGKGEGYIAEFVIPALVELEYTEAIPELVLIAESEPKSGDLKE